MTARTPSFTTDISQLYSMSLHRRRTRAAWLQTLLAKEQRVTDDLLSLAECGVPPEQAPALWDFDASLPTELGRIFLALNERVHQLELRLEQQSASSDSLFNSLILMGTVMENMEKTHATRQEVTPENQQETGKDGDAPA
jgi:hypothetical protein